MKQGIHPKINTDVVVTCACGNTFVTASTQDKITLDICSACHPFYTGTQKLIDTEGRIDKFEKKRQMAQQSKLANKKTKSQETQQDNETTQTGPQPTLKELLEQAKTTK
ncbi:50S ribosomal protein L31 [candidate division WWE3 bacterium]|uniref:Large ribosomal subunit protein bL31 n=1 Tax=candidate division WWE3 bacterium TaxID=2053526 RepID=A0A955J216_UNCKA|nr:50S ribosomal protein L31 [candidate division WWE3 bacterium]